MKVREITVFDVEFMAGLIDLNLIVFQVSEDAFEINKILSVENKADLSFMLKDKDVVNFLWGAINDQ